MRDACQSGQIVYRLCALCAYQYHFVMKTTTKHCSVPCCGEKFGSMFLFPKSPNLRDEWKSSCKIVRNVSDYMHICYRHFSSADVIVSLTGKHRRLKKGAVPMLNLPDSIRRKGRRNCIIYKCQKDESQDVSLHFFPKNDELRRKWASVCKVFYTPSRNARICSDHFADGSFTHRDNGSKVLKSGATPSCNLPMSFCPPSGYHKSKQWSACCSPLCDEEETFESSRASEEVWIKEFCSGQR